MSTKLSINDTVALANALTELGLKVWMAAEARRGQSTAGMSIAELVARIQAIRIKGVDELIAEGAAQVQARKPAPPGTP